MAKIEMAKIHGNTGATSLWAGRWGKTTRNKKRDAQCLPAQKMPALVRETRKQAGDY